MSLLRKPFSASVNEKPCKQVYRFHLQKRFSPLSNKKDLKNSSGHASKKGVMLRAKTSAKHTICTLSSPIQTILSVSESHRILRKNARGLYRRSGISPCPEEISFFPIIIQKPYDFKNFLILYTKAGFPKNILLRFEHAKKGCS